MFGRHVLDFHNRLVLRLNGRLKHLDLSSRQRIIGRVIADLDDIGVLSPNDEMEMEMDYGNTEYPVLLNSDERIRREQIRMGIEPEETTEIEIPNNRYGRTDAHEAVLINDVSLVRKLASEHPEYFSVKDNNGRTPVSVALSEENDQMIDLFKSLGLF